MESSIQENRFNSYKFYAANTTFQANILKIIIPCYVINVQNLKEHKSNFFSNLPVDNSRLMLFC